jgi:hypothetical protein
MRKLAALALAIAASSTACSDNGIPAMGSNQGAPNDAGTSPDLTVPPPSIDLTMPPPPDLACVPNQGMPCCYPKCGPGEQLVCLGANVCGYPCHCEAVDLMAPPPDLTMPPMPPPDLTMPPPIDMACVPNQGFPCCYPTCGFEEILVCVGGNVCGYPCNCVWIGVVDLWTPPPDLTVPPTPDLTMQTTPDLTMQTTPDLTVLPTPDLTMRPSPDLTMPKTPDLTMTPDLTGPPSSDMACIPNQGIPCCYPKCLPGEQLICLGANICGYPCSCVPADGGVVDLATSDARVCCFDTISLQCVTSCQGVLNCYCSPTYCGTRCP